MTTYTGKDKKSGSQVRKENGLECSKMSWKKKALKIMHEESQRNKQQLGIWIPN